MKELIIFKEGEIALKGLNKRTFEDAFIRNLKHRLNKLGKFEYTKAQSTIYAIPQSDDIDLDEAVELGSKVFGAAALCRALVVEKDFDAICKEAIAYIEETAMMSRTFKVEAKRSDKKFPMKSPEICMELGGKILEAYPHLTVDVKNPQMVVTVEIRDTAAYVHAGNLQGAGGIPVGTSGSAMLLLSGGIDSPVAGWMMAKRGLELGGVHFFSYPYTSLEAKQKVLDLAKQLANWCGKTVELSCKVNPACMGGVLLEMNGQRYDNTLKNRLKSIHSAMVQGA